MRFFAICCVLCVLLYCVLCCVVVLCIVCCVVCCVDNTLGLANHRVLFVFSPYLVSFSGFDCHLCCVAGPRILTVQRRFATTCVLIFRCCVGELPLDKVLISLFVNCNSFLYTVLQVFTSVGAQNYDCGGLVL